MNSLSRPLRFATLAIAVLALTGFFHERIRADVEKQLASRWFEKTASGVPDVLIHYHARVRQRVDTRTHKLVWRGWAEDSVDGVIDTSN